MNVGTAFVEVRPDTSGFAREAERNIDGALSGIATRLRQSGRSLFRSGAIITTSISGPLALGFRQAIDAASDFNETLSKSDTVFGSSAAAIRAWSSTAATNFGQSQEQALAAAGSFGNMFTQLGLGQDVAAQMSRQMVELASDFASFHNADITEVLQAQSAAFRGEYDSVQRFVPTITAAAVQQRALEMGLAATTDELTAQDKALATQTLLLEGAGEAMGDFDRTASGAANQQRILRAQFADTVALLGQALIPIVQRVLGVVQKLVEWFANLDQPMQNVALAGGALLVALGPLVSIIGGFATAIGVIISPIGLVVIGLAALAAGAVYAYREFEGFRNVVDAVASWLVDTAWPAVQTFAEGVMDVIGEAVAYVQDIWPQVEEAISHVLNVVEAVVGAFIDTVSAAWRLFGDEIMTLVRAVWDFIRAYVETAINLVQGIIQTVLALINGDWGRAWDGIKQILSAAWDYIRNAVTLALTALRAVVQAGVDAVVAFFSALGPRVLEALRALPGLLMNLAQEALGQAAGMLGGFVMRLPAIIAWFTELPGKLVRALAALGRQLFEVGLDALEGLWNGLKSKAGSILSWAGTFAGGLGGVFSRVLRIGSPSKVFEDIGRNIMAGLDKGLTGAMGAPVATIDALAHGMGQFGPATPTAGAAAAYGMPSVRVYIGDQEFRGYVRTEAEWVADERDREFRIAAQRRVV